MPLNTIALYGLFGVRNLGNEATLAATLLALRARLPEARIALISRRPPEPEPITADFEFIEPNPLVVRLHESSWVPSRMRAPLRAALHLLTEPLRAWRTRRDARRFDLLLVAGTGIADDFGQGPFEAPSELLRWCRAGRQTGARVRFASVGVGPVKHWLSCRWFAAALRSAGFRSYRDQVSLDFARSIGAAGPGDFVLPDLVFGLPVPEGCDRPLAWPPRTIGVGVMSYFGWNVADDAGARIYAEYLGKLEQVVTSLLEQGYTVRLLIGNRGGDLRVIRDLRSALERRGRAAVQDRLIATTMTTYVDVMREISACDLVVATRFHNVLKALKLGRPVVSIGYAAKNDELMREMGLGSYCHGIESFDAAAVLGHVRELAAMPQAPVETMTRKTAEYRAVLERQFDDLFAV
jgi:polysaccharide pyruvyl transferase WcaK-like protein